MFNTISQHKKLRGGQLVTNFVTDTIHFTYAPSGHILIQAKMNGSKKSYPFILDSGASNFVFSNFPQGDSLENNVFGIGIGSKGNVFIKKIKEIDSLQIGNLTFVELSANKIDFDSDCSEGIYGIIGTGVMYHLVWQIDFEQQFIVVAKEVNNLTLSNNKIVIPLHENKYSHHLSAYIKFSALKKSKEILIDLGNSGSLTFKEEVLLVDSLDLKCKEISGSARKGLGQDDKIKGGEKYYLLDSLLFNRTSFFVKDMPISTSPKGLNLLGLGFFKKYRTTISWADKKIILEPYEHEQNFIWSTLGFSTRYDNELNKVVVASVTDSTAAYRAGLPLGAEVVSINGIIFSDLSSYCDYKSAKLLPDTVNVTIKESNYNKEYTLVKEPIFN
ncbi:pepsin/retropepsin-like aspartic protease family protein [Saccharicrinis fermentans]|uniref:hypothetical protein n=1 Tax=Saccharicrinis fermentans TaxID=982 RepID=UPI0004826B14|nr:hypothetical protein [Saccharicrinis fermentans]